MGVTLLIGPIALSRAIGTESSSGPDVEASRSDSGQLLGRLDRSADVAGEESRLRLNQALASQSSRVEEKPEAPTTTTTTAPPTTTTTAPPPTTTAAPAPETTAAPAPAEEVAPTQSGGGLGDPYYMPTWDHLAQCESGGDWSINTGNGYYGGIQFSLSSWQAVGGTGYPHEHSRETQIAMGQRLWEAQGWGAWPACTSSFGWR